MISWNRKAALLALPLTMGAYLMLVADARGGGGGMDRGGFDRGMTPDDRRATGVDKLSPDEKQKMNDWINQHYTPNHLVINSGSHHYVVENLHNGSYIRLDDGNIYAISPDDIQTSSMWILPFPLVIEESNDPDYPYLLVNENTGSSVKAKQSSSSEITPPTSNRPTPSSSK